ncbi:uncharacterized protein DUF4391 [Malaciobacter marinus]|uniref:Uncharacterized protein DUF4391 n=1 Tax=Malaciobacter marinus TaxID=505249 RepID=A0AB36ZSH0_9BACT|nr:DUF4391 domain-containing protein [Malaciobacter marinus]PPK57712.1 uncharacterized protein DUF4391 [Malaciobacter marinus]
MRSLNLPNSAFVNRFLSKQTFIKKISNGKAIFSDIEKITWSYKLSVSTINIEGTKQVEEIHIFNMILKSKDIPFKALKEINKLIPYPILFVFEYNEEFCYGISLLEEKKYYFSKWNEEKEFSFVDTNLEKVYQNIVKQFLTNIKSDTKKDIGFKETIKIDKQIQQLSKSIEVLKGKIAREKQPNKQFALNKCQMQR